MRIRIKKDKDGWKVINGTVSIAASSYLDAVDIKRKIINSVTK